MPSDPARVFAACRHIRKIKTGKYPRLQDGRLVEMPWARIEEPDKLVILLGAVNWEEITRKDRANILLSNIDPSRLLEDQREKLLKDAGPKAQERYSELER